MYVYSFFLYYTPRCATHVLHSMHCMTQVVHNMCGNAHLLLCVCGPVSGFITVGQKTHLDEQARETR